MLFISTFRGKLGVVFLATPILLTIDALRAGATMGMILAQLGILFVFLILVGISFWIPDIVYIMNGAARTWCNWGEGRDYLTEKDYGHVTFARVYKRTLYAVGTNKTGRRITTTLLRCSCKDFKVKKRPCIHMHKLALELGVHDAQHEDL